MTALYNEIDKNAAAWLRQLIIAGHIAPGVVDERDIRDLEPEYVASFTQCHFFAGIGVWSRALRSAGWSDERPVWTGSCPCQPFSAAGKGGGFDDERHLWPAFHHLIEQCHPDLVLGEQVASKDGLGWLDLVHADLEGTGYAVGAVDTCAAGFGAPHIRQRLWWVGVAGEGVDDPAGARHVGPIGDAEGAAWDEARVRVSGSGGETGRLADSLDTVGRSDVSARHDTAGTDAGRTQGAGDAGSGGGLCGLADARQFGLRSGQPGGLAGAGEGGAGERQRLWPDAEHGGARGGDAPRDRPGPINGLWRDADWLGCRDGKWRPVEPGTFPLAHGAAARVGRLRGYGNAIVAPQAQAFVEAVMEAVQ
jgi:DNA (cytosine-5)-methyltransferase 1